MVLIDNLVYGEEYVLNFNNRVIVVSEDHESIVLLSNSLKNIEIINIDISDITTYFDNNVVDIASIIIDADSSIDCLSLICKIRTDSKFLNVPIIVITSTFNKTIEDTIISYGASEVLSKPLDIQQSINQIKSIIDSFCNNTYRVAVKQSGAILIEYNFTSKKIFVDPINTAELYIDINNLSLENRGALSQLIHKNDLASFLYSVKMASDNPNKAYFKDIRLYTKTEQYEWYRVVISVLTDEKGIKKRAIMTLNNINSGKVNSIKFEKMAKNDFLTNIPNRETFIGRMQRLLAKYSKTEFIIITFDVERCKLVYELFGKNEGDRLLKNLAEKTANILKDYKKTVYGRLVNDNFAICTPYDEDKAKTLVDSIAGMYNDYNLEYKIVICFGLYVIPKNKDSVEKSINRSLQAKSTIKGNFLQHYAYYDSKMLQEDIRKQFVNDEMVKALETGQFSFYLQPKVNLKTGKLVGAEALVRWNHPTRGIIQPSYFIPIFEENGFIFQLDKYIWEYVCKLLKKWHSENKACPISVNISRADLYNPRLINTIKNLIECYDLPHRLLDLELTESAVFSDEDVLSETISILHDIGFSLHMDDFGSGYSSLTSLNELEFDVIKLDMKFISQNFQSKKGKNILKYVIAMAKSIDLHVVAEGIENKEQRDMLVELGCDSAQGYYFSKPMPVEDFENYWLNCCPS